MERGTEVEDSEVALDDSMVTGDGSCRGDREHHSLSSLPPSSGLSCAMGQPNPPFPLDVACGYSNARRNPDTGMKREGYTRESDPEKWVSGHLCPPPVFRSIGLKGLPANLPAHRRLRSVLHRMRAVLPASANIDGSWPQAHGPNANMLAFGAPGRSLKGQEHTILHKDSDTTGMPHTLKDTLPEIAPAKLSPSQADKRLHSLLKPDDSLKDQCQIQAKSLHGLGTTWYHSSSKAHITSRRSTVSPLIPGDVCPPRTLRTSGQPAGKRRKRGRRKLEDPGAFNQTDQPLTSEEGVEDDLCQWLHSLGITEEKYDSHPLANRRASQGRGSPKLGGTSRKGRRNSETESGEQETCHMRRDRRPHFLPPIKQSDCLLHVPLLLPENSPPPSPNCSSNAPFFPLHVPSLPLHLPQVHRDASLRENKHKHT